MRGNRSTSSWRRVEWRLNCYDWHSITFGDGTQFASCRWLEWQLGMQLVIADPGCPWVSGAVGMGILSDLIPTDVKPAEIGFDSCGCAVVLEGQPDDSCYGTIYS